MHPLNVAILREAVAGGRIQWRKHTLQRLAERNISQEAVRAVLTSGERIRDYVEDKPFPSALFLGYHQNKALHVIASCDEAAKEVFIITVYEPSLDIFEADLKTRKKK